MQTKRQLQLGKDIQRIMSEILQRSGKEYLDGAFVTVSNVTLTPDLELAKINVSVLQKDKQQKVVDNLNENINKMRGELGVALRHKIRRIPQIQFYLDQHLDQVYEIERLLRQNQVKGREEE